MTSSLIRGRPRHATAHIAVRVAHAVLGGVAGGVWLMLPVMTINAEAPVPAARAGPVAGAAETPEQGGTSPADLVLPLVAGGAAGTVAVYWYVRRTRRTRRRAASGVVSERPPQPTAGDFERQAQASLVQADDCVRTSREELGFAEVLFGAEAVAPYAQALRAAETELAAAFAIRQRYERGLPGDEVARRQALVGIVGRCAEAGRRLDAEASGFDRLRALDQGVGDALRVAEGRFRELAGRTAGAQAALDEMRERYAHPAVAPVVGYVEQAKDRLVFATSHLNRARQAADSDDLEEAARRLRAAEGAIAQAGTFLAGVHRLAGDLRRAAGIVPAALTGGEVEIAAARGPAAAVPLPAGELHARIARADVALAAVRTELTSGPYDPLDALRRIARAVEQLEVGRTGVVPVAALVVARSATAAAGDFVATHRGAVGAEARTRLAEARRLLAEADEGQGRSLGTPCADADELAREARELAERDVRTRGNPYADAEPASGLAGAVLGGILLAEETDGGPPASFGGPETRGRRRLARP
ncbi:hypothetical protein [Streptomyces sp. NPDC054794]